LEFVGLSALLSALMGDENPPGEPPDEISDATEDEVSPASPGDAAEKTAEGDLDEARDATLVGEESWPGDIVDYAGAAPNITSLKPMRADSRGGTPITVFGAGFVPGCRVLVSEEECVTEFIDPFTLRFVSPSGVGSATVIVEAPSEKRSPEPGLLYFVEGPTVLRATPAEGPTEGGIEVVLEGTNFSSGCVISLFGEHAPDCVFDNPGRMRFTLPPVGTMLEGPVVVTALDGLSGRAENVFRYRPLVPRIDEVDPPHAWINGGKLVTFRGKDFHRLVKARIGDVDAVVQFRSATQIDVEVPPREVPCTVDVEVQNPDRRRAVLEGAFHYRPVPAPPKFLALLPDTGMTTGGQTIRVQGDNFTPEMLVRVGELTVVRRFVSDKLVDFDLPARALPGKVAIELVQGDVVVRVEEAFCYVSPQVPKIASVDPRSGPTGGGTRVVLEGEDFPASPTVRFGTEYAKVVAIKGNRIEVMTPAIRAAGVVDVVVSSSDRGDGIATKGVRYDAMPAPIITVVSPAKGTVDGGTELSIEGKNFAEGCVVLVGGVPVKRAKRISGSVLEAFTPGGDDGKLVDVAVKNPDGQQAVQKRAFQYDARYRS
jgi:hypothetical protein